MYIFCVVIVVMCECCVLALLHGKQNFEQHRSRGMHYRSLEFEIGEQLGTKNGGFF